LLGWTAAHNEFYAARPVPHTAEPGALLHFLQPFAVPWNRLANLPAYRLAQVHGRWARAQARGQEDPNGHVREGDGRQEEEL